MRVAWIIEFMIDGSWFPDGFRETRQKALGRMKELNDLYRRDYGSRTRWRARVVKYIPAGSPR